MSTGDTYRDAQYNIMPRIFKHQESYQQLDGSSLLLKNADYLVHQECFVKKYILRKNHLSVCSKHALVDEMGFKVWKESSLLSFVVSLWTAHCLLHPNHWMGKRLLKRFLIGAWIALSSQATRKTHSCRKATHAIAEERCDN